MGHVTRHVDIELTKRTGHPQGDAWMGIGNSSFELQRPIADLRHAKRIQQGS